MGITYTVSSSNCPSFSCSTSSSLLMHTAGPRGQFLRWRRSRKRLSVCSVLRCSDLWLQCSVSFVHCNHRSEHLKTEHTESLFLLGRHLRNWPRSKHEKRTAGRAWETWTVAADDRVGYARVRWEINFLLTFETATFFCVYPVHTLFYNIYIAIFECSVIPILGTVSSVFNYCWDKFNSK